VTRAIVKPSAGSEVFAGQSAIIHLAGTPDFIVNDSNAVFVELGEGGRRYAGGSRAKALIDLVDALREAKEYSNHRRDIERARFRDLRESTLDLEALVPVLARDKPLVINVDRASEIEMVLDRLGEFDIGIVLVGGREAWKVRDLLADRGVSVVIDPLDNIPRNFDLLATRLDNAAMLAAAGVTVAFMTSDLFGDNRTLTQGAGVAVANGMDWQDAVNAITSNAARIWGLADSYGKLERGMDADIVIWNGDPLELMSAPTTMFIKGQPVKLESRQTQLRDRYKDLRVFSR
ncbi:MAG: amidohydrolase family protein, partial [Pseudomonadales bacterium]